MRPRIEFQHSDHTYKLNGRRVPSVTQVLDHLNDWSGIPAIDLECKRQLGTDVHLACHLLARGCLDWATLDAQVRPYVMAAQSFLDETPGVTLASEQVVGSALLGVAGTLDLLREIRGTPYFIDWKISELLPKSVGPQLAAYELLFDHTFRLGRGRRRCKRLCVRLGMGTYRVEVLDDYRRDWSTFASCLNVFKIREARYG